MALVNDEIHRLHGALGLVESEFFCECGHRRCKERVRLNRSEFAALRAESLSLIVAEHENDGELGAADGPDEAGAPSADLDSEPMRVRIAKNEVMFRAANERIELEAQAVGVLVSPVAFLCECPDLSCAEIVKLTLDEYEEVRRGPARFLCLPGHQALAVQANAAVVVEERPDVVIADKIGVAGHIAAARYGTGLGVVGDGER